MERNSIIGMVVAMIVVIAGISVITIPMISEMSDNIHSTEMNDAVRYTLAETNHEVKLELINGIGYINDETIKDEYGYRMIMFSNSFVVIYDPSQEPNSTIGLFSISGTTSTFTSIKNMTAEDGTWTATSATDTTVTGTYEWLMAWNKHGNYGAVVSGQVTQPIYVNADSIVYICGAQSTTVNLSMGTIGNMTDIISIGDDPGITITSEQYTTNPNVLKVTEFGSGIAPTSLFIPLKYDVFTSYDQMLKTMFDMAPILIGIMFLAAIGMYMSRNMKM